MEEDEKYSFIDNHLDYSLNRFSSSYAAIGARQGVACAVPAINLNLEKSILEKRLEDEMFNKNNHGFNFIDSLNRLQNSEARCKVFIPKFGLSIDAHNFEKNKLNCNAEELVSTKIGLVKKLISIKQNTTNGQTKWKYTNRPNCISKTFKSIWFFTLRLRTGIYFEVSRPEHWFKN